MHASPSLESSPSRVLAFDSVSKRYAQASGEELRALDDVTFQVEAGRKVAIMGRSGSGKSTLLHLAAGIDVPSAGTVSLMGRDLARMTDRERTIVRRDGVGLVFQFFYLLQHLSVWENVLLPGWIARDGSHRERATHLLERVGLVDRREQPASKLSGGEMQRVAICRALLRRPRLLLADEPTGNLDDDSSERVMELLVELVEEERGALVFVTHSVEHAALADERFRIHSGRLDPA